jgi:predicted transcriptional regulator
MSTPETRVLTAHVPAALAAKVDNLAEQLDRSRGWVVKQALTAWVELEERRRQLTLEALADVDAGRGVPHEEVTAWARSLGTDSPLPVPKCK